MKDRLRALWDFDDLDATEERFRLALEEESTPSGRAEVLTQLARIEGLRGRFAEGDRLVSEAERAAETDVARARVDLERGRLLRTAGDAASSLPLFERAFEVASRCGERFVAVDAAHMAALVAGDREGFVRWTARGIEVAEGSGEPAVEYWLGPLLNNLGWELYEGGDYAGALDAFERALTVRERDASRPYETEIARYAVGRTLRALGRPAEAALLLERAVAWARTAGKQDAWFHEELAEDYAALERTEDAREQARLALAALPPDADQARRERLQELA